MGDRLERWPLDKKVLGLTGGFGLLRCRLWWCKGHRFSPRSLQSTCLSVLSQDTEPQNILSVWISPFPHFLSKQPHFFITLTRNDVTALWLQFLVYPIQVCSYSCSRCLCYTTHIPGAPVSQSLSQTLSGCPLWVVISTIMYLPYIIYSRSFWPFPRGNTRGEIPPGSLVLLVRVKKKILLQF